MKFEIELPRAGLPSDREFVGLRFGLPKIGDWYLHHSGKWVYSDIEHQVVHRPIAVFAPVRTWVPATVQDAIDALSGKRIECRGRDCGTTVHGILLGYSPGTLFPWAVRVSGRVDCYSDCEILKEVP